MFTGIIEETGTVKSLQQSGSGVTLTVSCSSVLSDVKKGDSIAIDGVCQTVTAFTENDFSVFCSKVTLDVTNFNQLAPGRKVNLERAMLATSRFGGHLVQGHVDGTAAIRKSNKDRSGYEIELTCSELLTELIIPKGSVAVNGISLTVTDAGAGWFKLYIIPETAEVTTIAEWKSGNIVNIETDIIGKYIRRLAGVEDQDRLKRKLAENGFI